MQQNIFYKRASTKVPGQGVKSFTTCSKSNLANTTMIDPEKLATLQEGMSKKIEESSL